MELPNKVSSYHVPLMSLPFMVIVNVLVTALKEESVAVYVTVVVPIAKASPGLWLDVSVTSPELSSAVGSVHVTTAFDEPLSVFCVTSAGMPEMVGSSESVTEWGWGKISRQKMKINASTCSMKIHD